ncbi:hypothetical protein NUW58_g9881 [Xylaria curta]|uniref:Uncharacterized protein n=1 Tax=Xylaria curta TaxID=42375 RepID=A0ACC1MUF3_9PEZI|nr:hypothetical protein NUW58_g9881 [Xylaria curta]
MGSSSQLPEGGLPFGCKCPDADTTPTSRRLEFCSPSLVNRMADNLSDETFLSPPLPHGDPILGPNDNSLLGTFFTGMESNEYNMFSYGEGLNFSDEWIGQIAPNLLGHSTSFGPQPPPDMASAAITGFAPSNYEDGFTFEQNMMPPPPPPPPPPPQQQQHIPPPLACPPQPAALQQPRPQSQPTLRDMYQGVPQSFHDQRSFCLSMEPQAHAGVAALLELQSGHPSTYSRTGSLNGFHPSPNMQPPRNQRGSHSQPIPVQSHNDPVRPSRSGETDTLFTDMMFGSQESTVQRPAEPVALQWGSDTHFARNQAFVPAQHETSEALENKRLATIREALKFTSSTPNTRASSPVGNIEQVPYATPESGSGSGNVQIEEDAAIPPKKRRKSKAKTEVDDGGDYAVQLPPKATARKRKSKSDLNGAPESSLTTQEAPGKRRKSAPSQPKPPRENLTDAQKRENHIKSEQKRRGAIKEGFDDLTFIVPNLQNGGYSKSSMLNMAGDWLESLIKENQMMESK